MQADFVNGTFDVSARGYRVRLINGRPATLIRRGGESRWAKQLSMSGPWGTFPDAPADMLATLVRFIDEQTAAYSPARPPSRDGDTAARAKPGN